MKKISIICTIAFLSIFSLVASSAILKVYHKEGKVEFDSDEITNISHSLDGKTMIICTINGEEMKFQTEYIYDVCIGESYASIIHDGIMAVNDFLETNKTFLSAEKNIETFVGEHEVIEDGYSDGASIYFTFKDGFTLSRSYFDVHGSNITLNSKSNLMGHYENSKNISSADPFIHSDTNDNTLELKNKTVLLINGMADDWAEEGSVQYDKEMKTLADKFKKAGFSVTIRNGKEVTKDTYTKEMPKNGLTFILSHGEYSQKQNIHSLQTGYSLGNNFDAKITSILGAGINEDFGYGNTNFLLTPNNNVYLSITEKELKNSMQQFSDPASQVFNMSCNSLTGSNAMADLMLEKGLGAYWGFEGYVGINSLESLPNEVPGALKIANEYADLLLNGYTTSEIKTQIAKAYDVFWKPDGESIYKSQMTLKLVGKENLIATPQENCIELNINIEYTNLIYFLFSTKDNEIEVTRIVCDEVNEPLELDSTDNIIGICSDVKGINHIKCYYKGYLETLTFYDYSDVCGGILPESVKHLVMKYAHVSEISTSKKGDTILTLPKSIESIDLNLEHELEAINLSGCSQLKTINSESLTSLHSIDISNCVSLKDITFKYCKNLKKINLSGCSSIECIGEEAFYGCYNLEDINLSGCSKIEYIGDDAFYGCNFRKIDLTPLISLTKIGNYAFYNPGVLKEAILPKSIKDISGDPFGSSLSHNSSVEKLICYALDVPNWDYAYNIEKIYVPDQSLPIYQDLWGKFGEVPDGDWIKVNDSYYNLLYWRIEQDSIGNYWIIDVYDDERHLISDDEIQKRYDYINIFPISEL